ncbi:MAG: histidinol-phosphate transaminase [Chloroflexota bacterium]
MTTNDTTIQNYLRPEIADLEEYTPIQPFEVLSQRLGRPAQEIIKLDANENPYGPVPAVVEALAEYPYYHVYPDPQQTELREALSRFTGVPSAYIMTSHGADEMLDYLCRLFLTADDAIINCPPTFGMYSFDAGLRGAKVHEVWRTDTYDIDVEQVCTLVNEANAESSSEQGTIKLLFLTAPNNPTGNWLSDEDLQRLLALPIMVVLDEAYVEFADYLSRAAWVQQHENLVILRTFSKAAGIAGLRLGYAICPLWLMEQLWKFKQPYNVNVAASVAGIASLRHTDQIIEVVELLKAERNRLYTGLQTISYLEPYPSQSNFILSKVEGRAALELKQSLENEGILVRYYKKPGLQNCIRVSVGRPEQTDKLLDILRTL